jgi:hypothetical protein
MAELRIRIELQRASKGIEMSKLSALAKESQQFLRMVAQDVGLNPNEGVWVALDFYNQGLGFNAEYQYAEVDHDLAATYIHAIDGISSVGPVNNWHVPGIDPLTIVQSARVAQLADEGETVRLGLLRGDEVEWRPLTHEKAAAVIEHFDAWVEHRGMLQGVIYTIYKEASPPYFTLRDYASRQLVRCEFEPLQWEALHKALTKKDAAVFVGGWIRTRRVDREIASVKVERIQGVRPLNRQELTAFFGAAPGWTGDLSTEDFIEQLRRDGDD